MYVRKGQLAKVVARPSLNLEKDSDSMTCAESAEEWETTPACLLGGNPTTTAGNKHNVSWSSQPNSPAPSTRKKQTHARNQTISASEMESTRSCALVITKVHVEKS